jgi:WD40 repeat protein
VTQWVYHTARVTCIAWSENGQRAVSGGLDTHVCVWSVAQPTRYVAIKRKCMVIDIWVDTYCLFRCTSRSSVSCTVCRSGDRGIGWS